MSIDPFHESLRRAASLSYMLLKETDPARLRTRIVEDTRGLIHADAVRLLEFDERGGLTLRDRAGVDPHLEERVDPLDRIEHARAADHEIGARKPLLPQHHATSAAASACTPTGPPVRTS